MSEIANEGTPPEQESIPRPIDFPNMPNPFEEINHPWDANYRKEIMERIEIDKIIRIEKGQIYGVDGIDPFEILNFFPSALSQVVDAVTPYSRKLNQLVHSRDEARFNAILRHLLVQDKLRCALCKCTIPNEDAASVIIHVKGLAHTANMRERGLVYPMECLSFWMYSLRIAQKDAPWFPQELDESLTEQNNTPTKKLILSFDFSAMPNPFHTRNMSEAFKERTSVDRIIRLERNTVFPGYDIDPFDVLCRFAAPDKQAESSVAQHSSMLQKLHNRINKSRFNKIFRHLFIEKELSCAVCHCDIESTVYGLVKHIIGASHVKKMKDGKLVYHEEALAFWMIAIRIAEKKAPWVTEETRMEAATKRQLATAKANSQIEIDTSIDPKSPIALFFLFRGVPNPCKNLRLVTTYMNQKLLRCVDIVKLKEDEQAKAIQYDGKYIMCTLCKSTDKVFLDTVALISHILSSDHINAIKENDGRVDMDAIFFWFDALARASKDRKEASSRPRNSLNRQLVAGMVDRTSPIALLSRCYDVSDPCPDCDEAMTMLSTKKRKCDIAKFDEAMSHYFDKTLLCGVCVEYKRIRRGSDFINHITSDDHIENMTRNEAQVSRKALRFWLDALCDAGALILEKEERKVMRLFGKKEMD